MLNLEGTPYIIDSNALEEVIKRLIDIEERVALLRSSGTLTEATIRSYYGEKRFEQVAESNALEGSTLSIGETEVAVLKGITITGHDPAYVRDAIALDRALTRIAELAKDPSIPTNVHQVNEVHALLLGDRLGAGTFRSDRVTIRGSDHRPPKTFAEVNAQMLEWQRWSNDNKNSPGPLRAAILHAWLTHIHPYIDGNGRTARAIGNLELIRSGYPPIIIRKKERDRYIEALSESDKGGDIRSFFDLVFDRIDGALTGLENSAKRHQAYNPFIEKIRQRQIQQLNIWDTAVKLLASTIQHKLSQSLEAIGGVCNLKLFDYPLDYDDFIELCAGRSVSGGWAFVLQLSIPGIPLLEKLAFVGPRRARMHQALNREGGPSLYWSHKNPTGFPKWEADGANSPYAVEATSKLGNGDEWYARLNDDSIRSHRTTELAELISDALMGQLQSV